MYHGVKVLNQIQCNLNEIWTKGLNQTHKVKPKLIQGILTPTFHFTSKPKLFIFKKY